jgi:hypothetical protein
MAATDCASCGNRVNVEAVVCPHCGTRRATVTMADAKLNKDEIRALLTVNTKGGEEDTGRGLLATMFLPHEQTIGRARTAELVLTVLTAPLVIIGIVGIALGRRRLRRRLFAAKGEAISAGVMTLFGGISFYSLVDLLKGPAGVLTAISIVALWVRAMIRSNAGSWRTREMTQVAKPDKPEPARKSMPKLPPARAVTAPSPVVRPSAPVQAPKVEAPTPSGEEPRLLR